MVQARHLPTIPSEPCSRCFGLGRHPRDISEACGECLGMGVLAGDSPSKEQLRIGPKFKLEVRPSPVKAMGLSVFAAEKIPMGAAVVELVGVVMTRQEARVIYPEHKRKGRFCMIDVPGRWHGKRKRRRYVLDLTNKVTSHSDTETVLGAASPRLTPRRGRATRRASSTTRAAREETWSRAYSTPARPSARPGRTRSRRHPCRAPPSGAAPARAPQQCTGCAMGSPRYGFGHRPGRRGASGGASCRESTRRGRARARQGATGRRRCTV